MNIDNKKLRPVSTALVPPWRGAGAWPLSTKADVVAKRCAENIERLWREAGHHDVIVRIDTINGMPGVVTTNLIAGLPPSLVTDAQRDAAAEARLRRASIRAAG